MLSEVAAFDFGLTAEQEARARSLHTDSVIVDMVFQSPCGYESYTPEMDETLRRAWERSGSPAEVMALARGIFQTEAMAGRFDGFREAWQASGVTLGILAGDLGTMDVAVRVFGRARQMFDRIDWLVPAMTVADVRRAKRDGKVAAYLYSQSVIPLSANLDLYEAARSLGLAMIQPTYNSMTWFGAGCTERTDAGVSRHGADAIARMNEVGIVVDTSHCGRQTTLDICSLSSRPVTACHTCAAGVFACDRAKSDPELRAVAATGGVVGVVAVPFFLSGGVGVTIEAMLDHIEYIANLVGWEHVGLGTDWPMPMPKWMLRDVFGPYATEIGFRPEHNIQPEVNLVGFDSYRDFPNMTRGLVKRGFSDDQVRGILGENALRVFAACWGG